MQANTTPVVVTTKADELALDSVVNLLDAANVAAVAVHAKARQAAVAACNGNFLDKPAGDRAKAIVALYMPHLIEKSVKEAFSAAVALLAADKPVRVAAASVTTVAPSQDYPQGQVKFGAPEVLTPVADKGEILPEGKSLTELSPEDAVAKLPVDQLKAAATVARQSIGIGRAEGGGRKATAKPADKRAPFMEELAACMKDDALLVQCFHLIGVAARNSPKVLAQIRKIAKDNEPTPKPAK